MKLSRDHYLIFLWGGGGEGGGGGANHYLSNAAEHTNFGLLPDHVY